MSSCDRLAAALQQAPPGKAVSGPGSRPQPQPGKHADLLSRQTGEQHQAHGQYVRQIEQLGSFGGPTALDAPLTDGADIQPARTTGAPGVVRAVPCHEAILQGKDQ